MPFDEFRMSGQPRVMLTEGEGDIPLEEFEISYRTALSHLQRIGKRGGFLLLTVEPDSVEEDAYTTGMFTSCGEAGVPSDVLFAALTEWLGIIGGYLGSEDDE